MLIHQALSTLPHCPLPCNHCSLWQGPSPDTWDLPGAHRCQGWPLSQSPAQTLLFPSACPRHTQGQAVSDVAMRCLPCPVPSEGAALGQPCLIS